MFDGKFDSEKVFTGGNIKHKQTCRTDELNMH